MMTITNKFLQADSIMDQFKKMKKRNEEKQKKQYQLVFSSKFQKQGESQQRQGQDLIEGGKKIS